MAFILSNLFCNKSCCNKCNKCSCIENEFLSCPQPKQCCYENNCQCGCINCNNNGKDPSGDENGEPFADERQTVFDVIESVALEEAGISHILNAEGEKLQLALKMTQNIDELLAVNNSIHKTIMHVSQLEQILYTKLETANELYSKLKQCN